MKQLQLTDLLSRGLENTLRRGNPWWQGDPLVGLPRLRRWAYRAPFGLLLTQQDVTAVDDPRIVSLPLSTFLLLK